MMGFLLAKATHPTAPAASPTAPSSSSRRSASSRSNAHTCPKARPRCLSDSTGWEEELLDQLRPTQHGRRDPPGDSPSLRRRTFPGRRALKKSSVALPMRQELGVRELEWIVDAVLDSFGSMQGSTHVGIRAVGEPGPRSCSPPF